MNFLLQSKLPSMILVNFSLLSLSLQFHCLAMMQLTPASDRIAADWNGHSKVNSLQLHCKESIYQLNKEIKRKTVNVIGKLMVKNGVKTDEQRNTTEEQQSSL